MPIYYDPADATDWHEGAPDDAAEALDKLAQERAGGLILYCAANGLWYEAVPLLTDGVVSLHLEEYAP